MSQSQKFFNPGLFQALHIVITKAARSNRKNSRNILIKRFLIETYFYLESYNVPTIADHQIFTYVAHISVNALP